MLLFSTPEYKYWKQITNADDIVLPSANQFDNIFSNYQHE